VVCHLRLEFEIVYLLAKFHDSSFSRSRDIIEEVKFKVGNVILTTPLLREFVVLLLGLDIAYMLAKFDNSNFSHSGDMVGAHQNLNGSR